MLHLAALANEGLEQIQAGSHIGIEIEIRRPWVEPENSAKALPR